MENKKLTNKQAKEVRGVREKIGEAFYFHING